MDYIIVGAGPTGLSLAYSLAINNKSVAIIESDNQLGGSWNSQWIDDKYFTENAPRVLVHNTNAQRFMKHIGMDESDFATIYGNTFQTNLKMLSFLSDHFNLLDYFLFFIASVKYSILKTNETVQSWLDQSLMSRGGKFAVKIISIAISDRPDKTNINDFFGMFGFSSEPLKQMIEPNKWHGLVQFILRSLPNVHIFKNTEVVKILYDYSTNLVTGVLARDRKSHYMQPYHGERVILCTQSSGLLPILSRSDDIVKNNWLPYKHMKVWGQNTYYDGFGFQLHFKSKVDTPDKWCWSCSGDWTVLILPVSNWLRRFTRDDSIKTVWSCCIVDLDTKSEIINKTANECTDENEVVNECLRQITQSYPILPVPDVVTLSIGLHRSDEKWRSKNTGFTSGHYGTIPAQGKLNNLFALGCFTTTTSSSVSTLGKSIDAVSSFLSQYEPNLRFNVYQ